ncbi:polyphosphate polymerase domain-containing protein [Ructibacterium gallinarum]|uniref:Polyphosphate polymerase domain-containing protein n=1 Tax=Ructibacterium gallinarum TaxID=2779355 RepID=A0A9D5M4E6_9FIRM|nr:polyphosphate polymerase domain-containing protein [Ructibacterium gallinarum]MBE5039242.1 polyphosphate polymerase domain-containing protein [Ructibacterium gallinarum]
MKMRHEYKYPINYMDYLVLKQRLDAVMKKDPHTGKNGMYHIRSLYFDTPDDKALKEKIDGVNKREKFRIRFYNGNDSVIHLEKKSKINGLCNKKSVPITREETEKILAGDISWMATETERPLLSELYSKMKSQLLQPKTLVDYERIPYVFSAGNVRITIDKNIRTGVYQKDFFDVFVPTVSASETVLLEVKYDAFIPQFILDILQLNNRRTQAFSKYAACRIYG